MSGIVIDIATVCHNCSIYVLASTLYGLHYIHTALHGSFHLPMQCIVISLEHAGLQHLKLLQGL